MRKVLLILLTVCLLAGMCVCHAEADGGVWMYACSVGKADAILVGAGGSACLIDAGHVQSRGKILAAMEKMGVERLDAVFVTHTDGDHVDGLEWLAESDIEIGAWYASAMYTGVKKEEKHPAVKAAKLDGQKVVWLKAGDSVSLGDAVLDVLAPEILMTDKDDNNSLVMMLRSAQGNILLAGDMELPEEQVLLQSGASIDCDVLKVGNHGDNDTTSEMLVRAASPKVAVISTSTADKEDTPDPRVVAQLESAGVQVAVTQDCTGGVLVRLPDAQVEYVNLEYPETAVYVEDVVAGEDIVTLYNADEKPEDLSGWYLFSDKGGEMLVLPEGTVIDAGARLVIGTNSTNEHFDLLWDDKKVIHKSKTDIMILYDRYGMPVSSLSNGY